MNVNNPEAVVAVELEPEDELPDEELPLEEDPDELEPELELPLPLDEDEPPIVDSVTFKLLFVAYVVVCYD